MSTFINIFMESHINNKQKGNITEAYVKSRFLELNWIVLEPIGDNSQYDCVIDKGDGKLYKVQIKYGLYNADKGVLDISTKRIYNSRTKTVVNFYTDKDCDYFATWNEITRDVYLIPISLCSNKTYVSLRINDPVKLKKRKNINWAKDFKI